MLPFHELQASRSRQGAERTILFVFLVGSLRLSRPADDLRSLPALGHALPGAWVCSHVQLLWWHVHCRHPWSSWEAEQRDQLVVPLEKSAVTCSPRTSTAFLSTTHALRSSQFHTRYCPSTSSHGSSGGSRVWHRGGAAFSQAHHGLLLAAEGISPTPCCVTWLLRRSSQCPAGITAGMMAWSLDCGWSLARQLHVAYTGFGGDREWVAASEMTARASASLSAHRHMCCMNKWEQKAQQPWSPS